MKKKFFIGLALGCVIAVLGSVWCARDGVTLLDIRPLKSKPELLAELEQTRVRVNQFYLENGFKYPVPKIEQTERSEGQPDEFIVESKGLFATMNTRTGRVMRFYNGTPFEFGVAEVPTNSTAVPPKWTKIHVLETAQKFIDLFDKPKDRHFAEPEATYKGHGQWSVTWSEVTSAGIDFTDSSMGVSLIEEAGPYEVFINLSQQPYRPSTDTPMPREKALKIARSALENDQASAGGVTDWDHPKVLLGVYSGGGMSTVPQLCWLVTYKFRPTSPRIGDTVGICINAYDGRVLYVLSTTAVSFDRLWMQDKLQSAFC